MAEISAKEQAMTNKHKLSGIATLLVAVIVFTIVFRVAMRPRPTGVNFPLSVTYEDYINRAGSQPPSGSITDTTAPVLSAGIVNRSSDTAAAIGFTTNEAGTAYYLVRNSGAAVPEKTAVKAGTSLGTVSGAVSGKAVTLTAGAKNIYVVVTDAAGNISFPLKIEAAAFNGDNDPTTPEFAF
jgi:hypothetical protein